MTNYYSLIYLSIFLPLGLLKRIGDWVADQAMSWLKTGFEIVFRHIFYAIFAFIEYVVSFIDTLIYSNPYPCSDGAFHLDCPAEPALLPIDFSGGDINIGVSSSELSSMQSAIQSSDSMSEFQSSTSGSVSDEVAALMEINSIGFESSAYSTLQGIVSTTSFWEQMASIHYGIVAIGLSLILIGMISTQLASAIGISGKDYNGVEIFKQISFLLFWWPIAGFLMVLGEELVKIFIMIPNYIGGGTVMGVPQFEGGSISEIQTVNVGGKNYAIPNNPGISDSGLSSSVAIAGDFYDVSSTSWITEGGSGWDVDWQQAVNEGALTEEDIATVGRPSGSHESQSAYVIKEIVASAKEGLGPNGSWPVNFSFILIAAITFIPYLILLIFITLIWIFRTFGLAVLYVFMPLVYGASKMDFPGFRGISQPANKAIKTFFFLLILPFPAALISGFYGIYILESMNMLFGSPGAFVALATDGLNLVETIKLTLYLMIIMWAVVFYSLGPFFLFRYKKAGGNRSRGDTSPLSSIDEKVEDMYEDTRIQNESKGISTRVKESLSTEEKTTGLSPLEKQIQSNKTASDKGKQKVKDKGNLILDTASKKLHFDDFKESVSKSKETKEKIESDMAIMRDSIYSDSDTLSTREMRKEKRRRKKKREKEDELNKRRTNELRDQLFDYDSGVRQLSLLDENIEKGDIDNHVDDIVSKSVGLKEIADTTDYNDFYETANEEIVENINNGSLTDDDVEQIFDDRLSDELDRVVNENGEIINKKLSEKGIGEEEIEDMDSSTKLRLSGLFSDTIESLLNDDKIDISEEYNAKLVEYASVGNFVKYETNSELSDIDMNPDYKDETAKIIDNIKEKILKNEKENDLSDLIDLNVDSEFINGVKTIKDETQKDIQTIVKEREKTKNMIKSNINEDLNSIKLESLERIGEEKLQKSLDQNQYNNIIKEKYIGSQIEKEVFQEILKQNKEKFDKIENIFQVADNENYRIIEEKIDERLEEEYSEDKLKKKADILGIDKNNIQGIEEESEINKIINVISYLNINEEVEDKIRKLEE